jgi:ketosteroid isomerase-like protein
LSYQFRYHSDFVNFALNLPGLAHRIRWACTGHGIPEQKFLEIATNKETSMKRTWILCLVGLLSLGSAVWSQAQTAGGTEKAVAALEQQWLQSQKTNNPDLVAPLLADNFVNTGSDGKVTGKAETLATAKATKYDSAEYEDVKVTAFGNTAIATGGFKAKGTDASGKPFDEHERFTDTWVKMPNGQWQCVASHGSPVKT